MDSACVSQQNQGLAGYLLQLSYYGKKVSANGFIWALIL